jgi:Protein of unknown function (DUF3616)
MHTVHLAKRRAHCLVVAILALACFIGSAAAAEFSNPWKVSGKLIGKPDKDDGKINKAADVSGIACMTPSGFPRACLVIDDELQSAQFVTLHDGKIVVGSSIALVADTHNGKPVELDGEGVAYHNGFFYVIGSHGRPRDKNPKKPKDPATIEASIATNSRIIRIPVDRVTGEPIPRPGKPDVPDVAASARLRDLIAADDVLKRFTDQRLDQNGVTVEGVAIRNGRLFAGFRGPSGIEDERGVILSAALGTFFDGSAPGVQRHLLRLGKGRGVRDLAAIDEGLLILAGPTADGGNDDKYAVYVWDGMSNDVTLLGDLPRVMEDDAQLKPEAILPLDRDASGLRVLILFDGAEEGGPREIRVRLP